MLWHPFCRIWIRLGFPLGQFLGLKIPHLLFKILDQLGMKFDRIPGVFGNPDFKVFNALFQNTAHPVKHFFIKDGSGLAVGLAVTQQPWWIFFNAILVFIGSQGHCPSTPAEQQTGQWISDFGLGLCPVVPSLFGLCGIEQFSRDDPFMSAFIDQVFPNLGSGSGFDDFTVFHYGHSLPEVPANLPNVMDIFQHVLHCR